MTMTKDATRQANLQAIQRMLDYAASESRREGLSDVAELLDTARRVLGNALSHGLPPPADPPNIRLAASRDAPRNDGNGATRGAPPARPAP
jgi:uncharacterized membrane protein YccC